MIGSIIGLILLAILLGVVWWGVQQLLAVIPIAEPFRTVVRVLMMVILALIAIYFIVVLLGLAGIHVPQMGAIK